MKAAIQDFLYGVCWYDIRFMLTTYKHKREWDDECQQFR
jgi:hypothetical protein